MANRNSKSNRKATAWLTALVVILMIACVGVGLIGYYSAGFSDWSDFEAAFGGNTDTEEPDVEDPDDSLAVTASYTPIEEGDFVKRIYFNKDFDVKSLFPGNVEKYATIFFFSSYYSDMEAGENLEYMNKVLFVGNPSMIASTDASEDTVGIFYSKSDDVQVIYLSSACTIDGVEYEAGWHIEDDYIDIFVSPEITEELFNTSDGFESIAVSANCEVYQIIGQNIFKYFISADGVFAEEPGEYVPIETGDVISQLYFNTDLDLKEFISAHFDVLPFTMVSPVIYMNGDYIKIMMYTGLILADGSTYEDFMAVKDELILVAIISNERGDTEVKVLYSSFAGSLPEFGTVETAGWQTDRLNLDARGQAGIVADINMSSSSVTGQNVFKYFISANDGVFADVSEL